MSAAVLLGSMLCASVAAACLPRVRPHVTLKIAGMECAMCAVELEGRLDALRGVASARADYESGQVEVELDPRAPAKMETLLRAGTFGKYHARAMP